MIGFAFNGGIRQYARGFWKDAADRKLSVASDALVMPRRPVSQSQVRDPPGWRFVFALEGQNVFQTTWQELGVSRRFDFDFF